MTEFERRHDPEYVACSVCGQDFDIARQNYYDDRCPSCRADLE